MKNNMRRNAAYAALIVLVSMSAIGAANAIGNASATAASASVGASAASAPVATKKENRALRRSVYAAFSKDKSIDAGDIGVSARNGAVTLTGSVTDATQIERAATLAKGVAGVSSVTNKLTVRRNFGQ